MKKFKKILVSSTLAVLVLASSTTPLFADTITTTQEMKDLREQATRTLYDYKVQEKFVEVYKVDPMTSIARWEPMAMSSQKETSAQVNTVYYENEIRKTPSNIDCGLVKKEAGSYFNDETRLTQLAKNATFPLSFPYTQGTTTNYKNPSVFKY
ncbi:MAG: hypothetical protein RR324_08005 [Cellulosilyticaceae bacterium]